MQLTLLILLCWTALSYPKLNSDFECHDPDAGGTMQNSDRRFLLFGSDDSQAFTGRDLIISNNGAGSIIAEVCRIVTCGFPFSTDLANAYPGILSHEKMKNAQIVKKGDFQQHIEGTQDISAHVVRAFGFIAQSDWWAYFPNATACVAKITGCDQGDVSCAERHAFQRLIRGPFRSSYTAREESRIHGVPLNIRHALLTLPHAYAPRFDAAIHIRAQFHHFENQADVNDPEFRREVKEWIASSEGQFVFREMEQKLISSLSTDTLNRGNASLHHGIISPTAARKNSTDPIYVYLAGDNEEVKEHFAALLERKHENATQHYEIKVMRMDAKSIYHVKNLARLKNATDNEGVFDLVFDWYALSLANTILAWRKGSSGIISTFSQSAARVSGTTKRTRPLAPLGLGGVGTKGYQLERDKRGGTHWKQFWNYAFLEDYRRPGDIV